MPWSLALDDSDLTVVPKVDILLGGSEPMHLHRVLIPAIVVSIAIAAGISGAGQKAEERPEPGTARPASLAPKPPMGWNSFDSYCGHVKENEVRAQADYMARHLARYGWKYVVVDYYWYYPQPNFEGKNLDDMEAAMDEYGRLLPAPSRFPSAAGGQGFKPLADYIHSLGLKFGIHIMRGIPRQAVKKNYPIWGTSSHAGDVVDLRNPCSWSSAMNGVDTSKAAGQAYYDSIVALYAHWGVDYIKADDMSWAESPPAAETFHAGEIEALAKAISNCGRPIVLSLSPGPTDPSHAEFVRRNAQLWRISGDIWDNWKQVKEQFERCRAWVTHVGPNHWPDADMLPLGRLSLRGFEEGERHSRLTNDEQTTLMTLWSIFRSPLMMGGDLPTLDAFTLFLLTNEEVLAVDQKSTGNHELFARGNHLAWSADVPGTPDKYLAVFNLADNAPAEIAVSWRELGLGGKCAVRDLWQRKSLGLFADRFAPVIKPHAAGLYRIGPAR